MQTIAYVINRILAVSAVGLLLIGATGRASERVENLIEQVAKASDVDSRVRLLRSAGDLSDADTNKLVESASRSKSERVRILGAWMLDRVTSTSVYNDAFRLLSVDESVDVRRITWQRARTEESGKVDGAFDDNDPVIRASALLRCSDPERIALGCVDASPFVRAVAIRRLGKVAASEENEQRQHLLKGLEICLMDYDPLVRSNAIICARASRVVPNRLAGIYLDDRPLVSLESVLAGEGSEDADLRRRWKIHGEFFPALFSFRRQFLNKSVSSVPPLDIGQLVVSLDSEELIGSAAAHLAYALRPEDERPWIKAISEDRQQNGTLREQLKDVLMQ